MTLTQQLHSNKQLMEELKQKHHVEMQSQTEKQSKELTVVWKKEEAEFVELSNLKQKLLIKEYQAR